jgi:hypothetical protein
MSQLSAQVMTVAHNPQTGKQATFPTPAEVPDDWVRGEAPDDIKNASGGPGTNRAAEMLGVEQSALESGVRIGTATIVGYLLWKWWL